MEKLIAKINNDNIGIIKKRNPKSKLQFCGDDYFALYSESKFNKFQKFLYKILFNKKIENIEEN